MSNVFIGKYRGKDDQGVKRVLKIDKVNEARKTLSGTLSTEIDSKPVNIRVSGRYKKWTTVHNRWLLNLNGTGQVLNIPRDPARLFGFQSVNGYCDIGNSTKPLPQLNIVLSWSQDKSGLAEENGHSEAVLKRV